MEKGSQILLKTLFAISILTIPFGCSSNLVINQLTEEQIIESTPIKTFKNVRSDREVRVDKSKVFNSIKPGILSSDSVEEKGGKLIAVYMTIKNTGDRSGDMFWSSFRLQDNKSRIFSEIEDFDEASIITEWSEKQGFSNNQEQLFPGGSAEIVKVFRVDPNAKGITLIINEEAFSIN